MQQYDTSSAEFNNTDAF